MERSPSPIKKDEKVVFFPTYAHRDHDAGHWQVRVHGWIFEAEQNSLWRAALLRLLRRTLKLSREEAGTALFKERLRAFLVDNERGKRISIRLGDDVFQLPKSTPDGHFEETISVSDAALQSFLTQSQMESGWMEYEALTRDGDERVFLGSVQTISDEGISVISDIDDTIKISNVTDRRELLANTFLRTFRSVEFMSDVYRSWAQRGACFHYVSSSPWQLFEPLSEMLARDGFPAGSVHLRKFRLKERDTLENLSGSEEQKQREIETIFAAFPKRQFLLVGDSGERDPEMYADLARQYPDNVSKILIRNVTGETADCDRFVRAFAGLPGDQWVLFDSAEALLHDVRKEKE